jgi:hypothetical protein
MHRVLKPFRWVILALAILSSFIFLMRYAFSGVEFRYWYDGLAFAIALIVASTCILYDRRWSKIIAALLTLPMALWFCYVALKVHALLPSSLAEQTFQRDPASWRQFLWNHPDVVLQYFIAFLVFIVATVDFVCSIRMKPVVLEHRG